MVTETRSQELLADAIDLDVATMQASRIAERPVRLPYGATSFYYRFGKRALDLALAIPLLIAFSPVILVAAVLVGLTSGWPVFYRARRVGMHGREFSMWKLRSMVCDAESKLAVWRRDNPDFEQEFAGGFKVDNDPRITGMGRFFRRCSIDELPQLWNVIRGDMSLVGPRPIVRDELANYGEHAAELLRARPGITGLWQLHGRNAIRYPERIWIELRCTRSFSLLGDLSILVRTLMVPLRFNGQ